MKASYTSVGSIEINIDLGLSQMDTIIKALEDSVTAGTNEWTAKDLIREIKSAKTESVRQIRQSLQSYE